MTLRVWWVSTEHLASSRAHKSDTAFLRLTDLREVVEAAINAEPELPGEIPEGMFQAIVHGDRAIMEETLRIIVRLTKQGIRDRLLAQLKGVGDE